MSIVRLLGLEKRRGLAGVSQDGEAACDGTTR